FFLQADFLYWKAFENGFNICRSSKDTDKISCDGKVNSVRKEKISNAHFRWSPGFRIGAGYLFKDSAWNVGAYWINQYFKANDHLRQHERLHWGLHLNVVDLLVSYKFCLVSWFSLKPYAGVRVADIHQRMTIKRSRHAEITEKSHQKEGIKGHNK